MIETLSVSWFWANSNFDGKRLIQNANRVWIASHSFLYNQAAAYCTYFVFWIFKSPQIVHSKFVANCHYWLLPANKTMQIFHLHKTCSSRQTGVARSRPYRRTSWHRLWTWRCHRCHLLVPACLLLAWCIYFTVVMRFMGHEGTFLLQTSLRTDGYYYQTDSLLFILPYW